MSDQELSHQFETLEQQSDAATLGMWVFLATEVLFFGGLFLLYTVYRLRHYEAFAAGSRFMDVHIGAVNTAVLLTSSLTMALAVNSAEEGKRWRTVVWILATMLFGVVFLGLKGVEYYHKFVEHLVPGPYFRFEDAAVAPEAQIFFSLYFALTGLHALHMVVGLGVMIIMGAMAAAGKFTRTYSNPIRVAGLYWHFVDIVWIFLFPLLYLIGTRG